MMFIKKAPNSHGFVNPRDIEDLWRDQFDWVYREMDYAVFPIAIHPDVAGRPQVLLMLERLYAYMIKHPGVRFITLGEMADDFARRQPFKGVAACAGCAACSRTAAAGSMRRRRSIRPRCGASGLQRLAIVRQVLAPTRVAVDDFEGASFVLRGPTGATELVDNLFDLWRKAEALGKRPHRSARQRAAGMRAMTGRIPLHVLTGFLGSGKTTLLNRVLRDPAWSRQRGADQRDRRGLDRSPSGRADGERATTLDVVVLKGGCTCCALRGDMVAALRELYARRADGVVPPFARVVMETTGLADPAPVLFTLVGDPALRHKFERGTVVATFDAVHGLAQLARHPESRKQIAVADRVVLTKTDLEALRIHAYGSPMRSAASIRLRQSATHATRSRRHAAGTAMVMLPALDRAYGTR